MIEMWLAFVAGIGGSVHCLGMCGGIVAALSMSGGASFTSRVQSQLFYNLGRITTYALLGALGGLLGASVDVLALKSVSVWVFCAANAAVIFVGVSTAMGMTRLNLSCLESSGGRFLAAPLKRFSAAKNPVSALPLGLLLGFLPCGLVYAPLVVATASGSPLMGACIMGALGLGTMPLLMIFGTASSALSATLRSTLVRGAGVVVALMGVAGVWRVLTRACVHCAL